MRRKRKKSRDYCVTGIIEVCNITRGRRSTTLLNLDEQNIAFHLNEKKAAKAALAKVYSAGIL